MSESDEFSAWAEDNSTGTGGLLDTIAFQGRKKPEAQPNKASHAQIITLQNDLIDLENSLPLDSELLKSHSTNGFDLLLDEVIKAAEGERSLIEKSQKKVDLWREKIEKNKGSIEKNLEKIKQNNIGMAYDRKQRDYWLNRTEQVLLDYQYAVAANQTNDWAWLTKKYGLKNSDGTEIDATHSAIDELANGAANNLAGLYHTASSRYEEQKKTREEENIRLIRENSLHTTDSETLQRYITNIYSNEIEPLQDGVQLMQELEVKIKALTQNETTATYGDLRNWSELFLNDFLKSNPKIHGRMVTEFRRLSSIPLPIDHW